MSRSPADDFDHPSFSQGHRLRHHVLYRLRRGDDDVTAEAPGRPRE